MKILLMVGHKNITKITSQGLRSWRSVAALKKSTGANGERDYFDTKIVPSLKEKLEKLGVQVDVIDAIWNDNYEQDYDLFISFHYDGGGTENRCMISSPLRGKVPPYINTPAHDKADEFCKMWKEIYPTLTNTVNRDNRITAGMLEYYGFDYVGMDTPSVIIEHFNHTSQRGEELKKDWDIVVEADYQVITKFLKLDKPVCMPEIKVKEDIPTEYEDALGLKSYNWYSKNWSWLEMFNQTTAWWNDSKKLEEVKDLLATEKNRSLTIAEELSKTKQTIKELDIVAQEQNKLINQLKIDLLKSSPVEMVENIKPETVKTAFIAFLKVLFKK